MSLWRKVHRLWCRHPATLRRLEAGRLVALDCHDCGATFPVQLTDPAQHARLREQARAHRQAEAEAALYRRWQASLTPESETVLPFRRRP